MMISANVYTDGPVPCGQVGGRQNQYNGQGIRADSRPYWPDGGKFRPSPLMVVHESKELNHHRKMLLKEPRPKLDGRGFGTYR